MSQNVINKQTDENIKSYLTEDGIENKTEDDKWSDVSKLILPNSMIYGKR